MSQPAKKYPKISLTVVSAGQVIPIDYETDKLYKTLTGVNVLLTDSTNKFSTLEIQINNEEVFPEGWEVIRVLFREQGPMGYDYSPLDQPAGGSRLKGKYTDVPSGGAYPYTVLISLRLENEEK